MDNWLASLTANVLRAQDIDEACEGFRRHAAEAGIETYAYINFNPAGPHAYFDTTYDYEWLARYRAENYLAADPTVAEGARSTLPFDWRMLKNSPSLNGSARKVFDEASEFGICEGLAVPFHGRHGFTGMMSMAFSSEARRREAIRNQPNLWLLGLYYHSAVERLLEDRSQDEALTPFEYLCLNHTAAGRSVWDVSVVTRRAEAEIADVLRSTSQKLGVSTHRQAIAKAVGLGLVSP